MTNLYSHWIDDSGTHRAVVHSVDERPRCSRCDKPIRAFIVDRDDYEVCLECWEPKDECEGAE